MTDDATARVIEGLATHKLVPFFGAGTSAGQLGVDWNAVIDAMSDRIGLAADERGDFLGVAQQFQDKIGSDAFVDFLRHYLIRREFDDITGWPILFLLSLNAGVLYTTNQDNLYELASLKYGRPHRVISQVEDLTESPPRDDLLIKYHGDLAHADSLIFTEKSYRDRIAKKRHFLNIRLQSDLLSKGFLFIGYSMRDINIKLLFQELRQAFGGALPPSYMIAYHYDPALEALNRDYGVIIIDPKKQCEPNASDEEAFNRYLKLISESVLGSKHRREIDRLFAPDVPPSSRIATLYDVDAITAAAERSTFSDALKIYRNLMDRTMVPEGYASRVTAAFLRICEKAADDDDLRALSAAVFNMTLPAAEALEAMSGLLVAVNRCSRESGFPSFLIVGACYPSEVLCAATSLAIASLRDKGLKVTEQFRRHAEHGAAAYKKLPEDMQRDMRALMEWAWQSGGQSLPPHVLDERGPFKAPLFEDIMERMMSQMPKSTR